MHDQLRSYENNMEAAHLNKSLVFRFHNLEPVQFWNRFQWIRYSGMKIPIHLFMPWLPRKTACTQKKSD